MNSHSDSAERKESGKELKIIEVLCTVMQFPGCFFVLLILVTCYKQGIILMKKAGVINNFDGKERTNVELG